MTKKSFCRGAPHKFTEETCAQIIIDIKKSLPYHIVAESNGVHRNTLAYWLKQGQADIDDNIGSEKAQFYCNVKKAIKETMDKLLTTVETGAPGWQGSAWILERRWWKDWSSKVADLEFDERLTKLENENKNKDVNHGNFNEQEEEQATEK